MYFSIDLGETTCFLYDHANRCNKGIVAGKSYYKTGYEDTNNIVDKCTHHPLNNFEPAKFELCKL